MLRVLYLLFSSVTLVGCAHQQPPMVWIRLDGQKATGDPVLTQQFETDRTICLGKTQQANLSGVAVYQGGIYGAIAASERAQAVDAVAKGCMAEKGYTQVPQDQAETKSQELAAINMQKQAQSASSNPQKKK